MTFNDRSNAYQLNQVYLILGREARSRHKKIGLGGQIDFLFGTDYLFTSARGLETYLDGTPHWNSANGPRAAGAAMYGFSIPQAYAEVFAPVGRGLSVKLGHFYSILGCESAQAPENFFYSHSYTKQYGEPMTHTGLLASCEVLRGITLHGGFTRGWDAWEDVNDSFGFLGGASWTSRDQRTAIDFALHAGSEDPLGANTRTSYSLVLSHQFTERFRYVCQHDLGVESDAVWNGANFVDANWHSLVNYFFYQLNNTMTLGARAEWFCDEGSTRVFQIPSLLVNGDDYGELALGLNWKPNTHVTFRPEVRWDWSGVEAPLLGADGMFNSFTDKSQFTASVDLILTL